MSNREIISTSDAPAAIGAYSQAIVSQGQRTLYTSGQIPIDPETQQMVGEGDVALQTRQVLKNLEAVLKAADMTFEDVVRATIYLKDMNDFPTVNEIYGQCFLQEAPARACVQVARLPKDSLVEIDFVAVA